MDIYEVISIILLYGVLLAALIDTFSPQIYRGALILKLRKVGSVAKIGYSIMYGGLLLIWLAVLVFDHIERNISIIWVIYCTLQLIRINRAIEIREKGMNFDLNFHRFTKIISYTRKSDNILRIHYNKIFKQDDYYNLEINDKDMALEVDEILQKYVKKVESFY